MEEVNSVQAIRDYFGSEGYPKITIAELKELTKEERQELAKGACKELGKKLKLTA